MKGRWEVNDKQWAVLEPILVSSRQNATAAPVSAGDTRAVLNAVLWVLGTGAQWNELPGKYPPHTVCHRQLRQWIKNGKLQRALCELAQDLRRKGKLSLEEVRPEVGSLAAGNSDCCSNPSPVSASPVPSPLLPVFLSPLGSQALARMNFN